MSLFTDLTLADGSTTPVTRTFKAVALVGNDWTWYYAPAGSVPLGFVSIKSQSSFPKDLNGITSSKIRVRVPFLEQPAGEAPRVPYYCEVDMIFKVSGRATAQERKDLLAYAKNFLASARASEIVVDGDPPR